MITGFDAQNEPHIQFVEQQDMGAVGRKRIFDDNQFEVGMLAAHIRKQAFGSVAGAGAQPYRD